MENEIQELFVSEQDKLIQAKSESIIKTLTGMTASDAKYTLREVLEKLDSISVVSLIPITESIQNLPVGSTIINPGQ